MVVFKYTFTLYWCISYSMSEEKLFEYKDLVVKTKSNYIPSIIHLSLWQYCGQKEYSEDGKKLCCSELSTNIFSTFIFAHVFVFALWGFCVFKLYHLHHQNLLWNFRGKAKITIVKVYAASVRYQLVINYVNDNFSKNLGLSTGTKS